MQVSRCHVQRPYKTVSACKTEVSPLTVTVDNSLIHELLTVIVYGLSNLLEKAEHEKLSCPCALKRRGKCLVIKAQGNIEIRCQKFVS
jgi:hypothetical protein